MAQINKPSEYFNTVTYSGNGSTQSITGVNFTPDWVWIKKRNDTAFHQLFDVVRGATNGIFSNSANAEAVDAGNLQSFDSDGFTSGSFNGTNASGGTYASWNWRANGAGVSNTDGSITSTVSFILHQDFLSLLLLHQLQVILLLVTDLELLQM
jgi:hypothetical protein